MAFTQPEGPQQSPTKEEVADVALDKHLVHEDHQIQEQLGLIPTEAIGQGTGLEGSEKKGNKVVQLPRLVKKAGSGSASCKRSNYMACFGDINKDVVETHVPVSPDSELYSVSLWISPVFLSLS